MKNLYDELSEIGTPGLDSSFYPGQQEGIDTCAIRAQQHILQMFGVEKSEDILVNDAISHGEYVQGGGTKLGDIGNLLAREGIEVNRFNGATPAHLVAELAQGHKIIAAVDSGEIWADSLSDKLKEFAEDMMGRENADHAVVVTGIDPFTYDVTISDPGDGNALRTIPANIFFNAFKDGANYMVSTAIAPKDFIPIESKESFISHFFGLDEFMDMIQHSRTEIIHTSFMNGDYCHEPMAAPQFMESIDFTFPKELFHMTDREAQLFAPVINMESEGNIPENAPVPGIVDLFKPD